MENNTSNPNDSLKEKSKNFIYEIIDEDFKTNKWNGRVHTRFPPEPNGYLHIGHAKSICLNYGIARDYKGKFNLRFDDTNPTKEEQEYVDSIIEDVKWLGGDFQDRIFFASDYFEQMYEWAVKLIKKGKAYVDDSDSETMRGLRGTVNEAGKESPYRNRSLEENLDLFERMRKGEFKNGEKVLRAKIDMSSPNMLLRDPVMYRIIHSEHHRTGSKWCIYPTYDWAHGLEDSIEGITHSICTLEFEVHRPLYDWFLNELEIHHPQQIEFARLNLTYTVMSKRKLLELVEQKFVDGWDDPRMPTISAFRRRGYTSEAIQNFAESIGVAKRDAMTEIALLEFAIREDLNKKTQRVIAVLDPLKVIITNYTGEEELEAVNNPEDAEMGHRKVPFAKELYIERSDFMENPVKGFHRLIPGGEVRLRYAYIIKCDEVIKNDIGEVIQLNCSYDAETKSGTGTSTKKVKGTIHWVSINHAVNCEVRLYDRLLTVEDPASEKDKDYKELINPKSLDIITNAKLEPFIKSAKPGDRFQFERQGYFCVDTKYTTNEKLVFNRTVTLKDTWAKTGGKK
ncbi:MAG: glutamine--tRNA ligase/YqeY domain fusion protein [Ignavibacteriaceae bacterium]|nr:glutamine--tRNA ligase/YqeY domain fusion protein [Ignavibacterium sp.]MCC6255640.1 glutamine--tRNA ligase/YqeY domain fusion protein [Ignavibacteriaceae bacterium]HMN24555.1 glutamine--tRNA ligase/YqeY domain fusion protein [Ignavibacteriaceae bacterium]HRP93677.1 glutamine--tRNA ligase/YqeY domain fusion protein [Ignavibacteriaceae bacterium]HRQ52975.1 glutamine--tRNA ligase/YqeY domain fusion protein [Ignavibacteriaceae bacterium]